MSPSTPVISSMFRPARLAAIALAAASAALVQTQAQAATPPVADGDWHGGISIGLAASSGNTDSTNLAGTLDTYRLTNADKITLYGYANYASSRVNGVKTTSADSLRLGGRYDYNLSSDVFAFGTLEGSTNRAADLDSRVNAALGVGYKLINDADTTFNIFGGVGAGQARYTTGLRTSGGELYLGEESTHKISASTSLNQRLTVHPGSGSLGTLTTFDAGLATAIAGGWTVNTGLSVRNQTRQPAGVKSTDTLLTVGFGYKF